jgi:hypothetical protein
MQLDFRQFVLKLEAISDIKPLPHQDLVQFAFIENVTVNYMVKEYVLSLAVQI